MAVETAPDQVLIGGGRLNLDESSCGAETDRLACLDLQQETARRSSRGVWIEYNGFEITDANFRAHQQVGRNQTDDWKLFGFDFLHAVIELLAMREIGSGDLLFNQLINFSFPRRGRRPAAEVPEMIVAGGKPDVDLRVGVDIAGASPMMAAS